MKTNLNNQSMKYISIMILMLFSINLIAQSTSWSEYKLKEYWKTNGADEIEGIYENTVQSVKSPKYSVGLIKTDYGYTLVFLKVSGKIEGNDENGYYHDYTDTWNTGDVKAYLTSSATPFLFKTKWYMADKSIAEDLYITFESGFMKIIWTNGNPHNLYIKLFPSTTNKTQSIGSSKFGSGTGFGISSNGIIVTNYHVIDGAKSIKVRGVNSDFNKTYKVKILVSDKNNDLALIQIDDYGFTSLGTIPFTIKTSLAGVGEDIFVLGYPLRATMGDEIKLTNGIVSSKTGFQGDITSYQISAPVQPGNSGGPLFDYQGNLIGIINAKHNGAENASYGVKSTYLTGLIDILSSPLKLQTLNLLTGKSLTQQVELVKKFVYIIETE